MRNPPVGYKTSKYDDYSKSGDSNLLRKGFADGGAVNKSVSDLKQLLADTGVDQPTKTALANRNSNSGGSGNEYWVSNTPKFDEHGMPMRRAINTPGGLIPMAEGGLVKKGKSK